MKAIRIKEWLANKIDEEAHAYNISIKMDRNREWGTLAKADENGYMEVYVEEEIKETEKAINVKLEATKLNKAMNCTTWTAWIPKSQIA